MGRGLPDATLNLESDDSDVITSYHVAAKIRHIESDLLASGSPLDDGAENSDGDGDNIGVDLDNIKLTEPSSSNYQLTCH